MYHWYLLIKQDKPRATKEISSIIAERSRIDADVKTRRAWLVAGLVETVPQLFAD